MEAIARDYASTIQDLERFYRIGVAAAEKFRSQTTQERYDSNVAWVGKQTILESKKNASSLE